MTRWQQNRVFETGAGARGLATCAFSRGQKRDEKYVSGSFTFAYYFTDVIFYFSGAKNLRRRGRPSVITETH